MKSGAVQSGVQPIHSIGFMMKKQAMMLGRDIYYLISCILVKTKKILK